MKKQSKKLVLDKNTVKVLKVKSSLKAGADLGESDQASSGRTVYGGSASSGMTSNGFDTANCQSTPE